MTTPTLTAKHSKEAHSTINIYPTIVHTETSDLSQDFGIEIDKHCENLHSACKGFGTNHKLLITTLSKLTPAERHKTCLRYKELHSKDLRLVMKKEAGNGNYGLLCQYLALSPADAEGYMLKKACDGIGTNELAVYPILCGRSNADMLLLKKSWYNEHTADLGQRISSELGGNLYQLISSCLQAAEEPYDEHHHTLERAQEDATEFYKAGQGRWFRADGKSLFKLVATSPPKYLNLVDKAYAETYGYTLTKAMEKNLGGYAEDAALFTLGMKLKPYETVAHLIKKACKGMGTNELLLTCCVVRYTDILSHVNLAHIELFSKTIHERVRSECGGNYGKLMLGLLNAVVPES